MKNAVTWHQTSDLCITTGTNLPPKVEYYTCWQGGSYPNCMMHFAESVVQL